jgi:ACT domain-containing protein
MNMKAVITVIGQDKPGIIAKVTTVLFESGINIDDISQTNMQGLFTMVMIVNLNGMNCPFGELQSRLQAVAESLGMEIRMQREEIFSAMHQV